MKYIEIILKFMKAKRLLLAALLVLTVVFTQAQTIKVPT